MRWKITIAAAMAVSASLLNSVAQSAIISVVSDATDFESQKRSNTGAYIASQANTTARAGFQSNFNGSGSFAPGGIMPVYVFQLPALGSGETVTSASFSVGIMPDTASTSIAPTFNADLYALGFLAAAATPTVADAENYWYFGNTPQASLPGTAGAAPISGSVDRIIDDFLVPTDFVANGGTETLKTGDISSYIQSLYSDPVGNGFTPGSSYLVVRVTPDADSAPTVGTQRYSLSNQGVVNPNGENRPTITLNTEVVPEPSCFVLLCMGLCGLIVRRRVG